MIEETDDMVKMRIDPFAPKLVELAKKDIDGQKKSTVSEMPSGLINVLHREEILDLVAYLRSGCNPEDKTFKSE